MGRWGLGLGCYVLVRAESFWFAFRLSHIRRVRIPLREVSGLEDKRNLKQNLAPLITISSVSPRTLPPELYDNPSQNSLLVIVEARGWGLSTGFKS